MKIQDWLRLEAKMNPKIAVECEEAADTIDTLTATLRQADERIAQLEKSLAEAMKP